jgi:hypothetical protein
MKPPFFPLYRRLREHLEQDPIGQVSRQMINILDRARVAIGLVYPQEL